MYYRNQADLDYSKAELQNHYFEAIKNVSKFCYWNIDSDALLKDDLNQMDAYNNNNIQGYNPAAEIAGFNQDRKLILHRNLIWLKILFILLICA